MLLILVPAIRRITDLFAARAIETRYPGFRNSLISALQLAWRNDLPGSMRSALTAKAAGDLAVTPPWTAIDRRAVRRTLIAAAGALSAFLLYATH